MNVDAPTMDRAIPGTPPDWSHVRQTGHFVQFYENDDYLVASVGEFIGRGHGQGNGGIVIATAAHRRGIETMLTRRGIDVAAAQATGQLILLDAADTLAKFMDPDGTPDPVRFAATITPAVLLAGAGRAGLRAFGEMVALLWADGNRSGAVQLEQLWNDLARHHEFSLLCGYPMNGFGDDAGAAALHDVCACHTHVVPTEHYVGIPDTDERLREVARLQQKAHALEAEIAHRREAQQALLDRERELSDFFENATEGLHKVGPDGRILWANRAELDLLGYTADEYIGHPIADFYVEREVIEDVLARLLRGERLYNSPARLRCKDGSVRHVLVNSSGYFVDGKFVHTRCFTRDVTERVLAERRQQELLESERAARSEAERIGRMKDEFLATLSHELRTPLNAILGWSHLIRLAPADTETVAEGVSIIDRNARLQAQLIEDLLEMSRIISGKLSLDVRPVELTPILQAAVEGIGPEAQDKGIAVGLDIASPGLQVEGDPNRLQQVVCNLLTNALKFTPAGGRIDVRVARRGGTADVSVRDTGHGIPPEFLPHVFERFRQGDASTTRKHGGLGIGLSIVKTLVDLHGGTVRADSPGAGLGATFTVSLPLLAGRTPAGTAAAPQAHDGSTIRLDGVRILVVDDEPDGRQFVVRILRDRRADVASASSAAEALDMIARHKPHVLVSDIGMPGTDGYELIRQVRARPAADGGHVPAVAVTAFARSEDRTRALLAGYQAHIPKPVEPRELLALVASLAARTGA